MINALLTVHVTKNVPMVVLNHMMDTHVSHGSVRESCQSFVQQETILSERNAVTGTVIYKKNVLRKVVAGLNFTTLMGMFLGAIIQNFIPYLLYKLYS